MALLAQQQPAPRRDDDKVLAMMKRMVLRASDPRAELKKFRGGGSPHLVARLDVDADVQALLADKVK